MAFFQTTLVLLNSQGSYQSVYDSLDKAVLQAKQNGIPQQSVQDAILQAAHKYGNHDGEKHEAALDILDRVSGWCYSAYAYWETQLGEETLG